MAVYKHSLRDTIECATFFCTNGPVFLREPPTPFEGADVDVPERCGSRPSTSLSKRVVALLRANGDPMSSLELAMALGVAQGRAVDTLITLALAGKVDRLDRKGHVPHWCVPRAPAARSAA